MLQELANPLRFDSHAVEASLLRTGSSLAIRGGAQPEAEYGDRVRAARGRGVEVEDSDGDRRVGQ